MAFSWNQGRSSVDISDTIPKKNFFRCDVGRTRGGPSSLVSSPKTRSPKFSTDRRNVMNKIIFVSLPIRDLEKSIAFYTAIGAKKNPQFSDDTAACMVFSATIYAMLITHEKWKTFTDKPTADAHASGEVALILSAENRDEVNAMADAAANAGGKIDV